MANLYLFEVVLPSPPSRTRSSAMFNRTHNNLPSSRPPPLRWHAPWRNPPMEILPTILSSNRYKSGRLILSANPCASARAFNLLRKARAVPRAAQPLPTRSSHLPAGYPLSTRNSVQAQSPSLLVLWLGVGVSLRTRKRGRSPGRTQVLPSPPLPLFWRTANPLSSSRFGLRGKLKLATGVPVR